MQREGAEGKDSFFPGDYMGDFHGFGLFGSHRGMMSNLLGGRDPFDDPFFSRPLGSMVQSNLFGTNTATHDKPMKDGANGLVIQEISSDEEREGDDDLRVERKDKSQDNSGSSEEPSIEHPDDTSGECQIITHRGSERDKVEGVQARASRSSIHTCKVTYCGVDGAYYTSTRSRKMDDGGVLLEETKEADKTTGQAIHRISRGIHDKGHSVTRKLNSDGKVDTLQTLHNLNEDELSGFDRAWKGNFQGHKHVSKNRFTMDGNADSSGSGNKEMTSWEGCAFPSFAGRRIFEHDVRDNSRAASTKKVVRINIE